MKKFVLALLVSAAAAAPATAANLLQNGSFELGANGLQGWTLGGVIGAPPLSEQPVVIPYNSSAGYPGGAHGEPIPPSNAAGNPGFDAVGRQALYFVADGPGPQTLSQTVALGAPGTYRVGFDYYIPLNGFNNPGGATLTALLDATPFATFTAGAGPAQTWIHFSDDLFVPTAGNVTFQFSYAGSTTPAKDFVIDRAYLAAVPEPATWAMMIGGFGLLGAAARRRRNVQITYA